MSENQLKPICCCTVSTTHLFSPGCSNINPLPDWRINLLFNAKFEHFYQIKSLSFWTWLGQVVGHIWQSGSLLSLHVASSTKLWLFSKLGTVNPLGFPRGFWNTRVVFQTKVIGFHWNNLWSQKALYTGTGSDLIQNYISEL